LLALSEGVLLPILNFVQEKPEIAATAGATASPRHTGFGGVFLLLPLLDELPLAEATRGWPDAAGIPPSALVRWLILVKCLGAGRPAAAARDPLIQELSGLPSSTLSATLLGDWQRRVSVNKVEAFLLVLARWRRQTGSAAGRVWIVAPVKTNRREASLLLTDAERGCCLFAVPEAPPRLNLLARTLAVMRAARAGAPVAVLCGPAYRAAVEKADPEIMVLDADDRAAIEQCGFAEALTPALSGLPATGDAFDFLALPRQFRLSSACDLALSIAAQGLLRDFAWRVPGFAWSQPAYVRENFLDCEAVIEDEEDRCVVKLTRPPLNLLLNMTGLNRRRYKLSWSEGRPFELYPDGA
jgi:hypothetical protein